MYEVKFLNPNFTPVLILISGTNSTLLPLTPGSFESVYFELINEKFVKKLKLYLLG